MKKLILFSFIVLISACTSIYQAPIQDFQSTGYKVASYGMLILTHEELSKKNSPTPVSLKEYDQYQAGFESGKETLCKISNAFEMGYSGIGYVGQCEGIEDESQIRFEWQRGFERSVFDDDFDDDFYDER